MHLSSTPLTHSRHNRSANGGTRSKPPETTASVLLSNSRKGRGPGPSGAKSRLDATLPSSPGDGLVCPPLMPQMTARVASVGWAP
jgi:hypothetical protein